MASGKKSVTANRAAGTDGSPRIIIRIDLTPEAKGGFGRLTERTGRTQVSTIHKLVEWFAGQPAGVQAAVLGQYPKEIEAEVARMLLEKMK